MLKRRLKEPFGKAGLTVAVLALVLAMVGGAYAAGGLTKSQEKQVKKIAKKYAGKPGAPGANGTNGTNGSPGAKGDTGAAGTPGTSVTNTALAKGSVPCPEGGAEFKVGAGAATKACTGKEGPEGTFGGQTLPSGQTLKGFYAGSGWGEEGFPNAGVGVAQAAVSYALPLSAAPEAVYIAKEATPPAECPGTAAAPAAEEGFLCVFATAETNANGAGSVLFSEQSANGFIVAGFSEAKGRVALAGTWAVSAE